MSKLRIPLVLAFLGAALGVLAGFYVYYWYWPEFLGGRARSHHERMGWKAEQFFNDPKVIELCYAIEENNLPQIRRLVESGVDVNARGKDNITPLFWAFPDNKLERFRLLLSLGADPNVRLTGDLGKPKLYPVGSSIPEMAARSNQYGFLQAALEFGADPNLTDPRFGDPLIEHVVSGMTPEKKSRLLSLLKYGVEVNKKNSRGTTSLISGIRVVGRFDLALILLDHGADPKIYRDNDIYKAIHYVAMCKREPYKRSPEQEKYLELLIKRLESMGESLDEANKDLDYWDEYCKDRSMRQITSAKLAMREKWEREGTTGTQPSRMMEADNDQGSNPFDNFRPSFQSLD